MGNSYGIELVNSIVERTTIKAISSNSKKTLKYCKDFYKASIEQGDITTEIRNWMIKLIRERINKMNKIEYLCNKYKDLHLKEYENRMNELNSFIKKIS